MSDDGLTVLLLPGTTTDADALGATLASVRAEAGGDASVVAWDGASEHGHAAFAEAAATAGVPVVPAAAITAAAGIVGFVRPGDRWRPGALEARKRPLTSHPTALLSVAGHRRVPSGGDDDGLVVTAPMPPVEPAGLLLRPRIEASAVLVRGPVLDETALELLHRPHGDAVVWARLIGDHGHLPSGEIAADVRLDPARHGFRSGARTDAMLATLSDPTADDDPAGHATLRRELLRRLFVEADGHVDVDVLAWTGPAGAASPRVRGVVADLAWALHRQRESLAAERVTWPTGQIDREERVTSALDIERVRLGTELAEIYAELRVRDATIRRLEAELAQRDKRIRRLEEVPA